MVFFMIRIHKQIGATMSEEPPWNGDWLECEGRELWNYVIVTAAS